MEIACKPRSAQKHTSIKTQNTGVRAETGEQEHLSKQHAQEKSENNDQRSGSHTWTHCSNKIVGATAKANSSRRVQSMPATQKDRDAHADAPEHAEEQKTKKCTGKLTSFFPGLSSTFRRKSYALCVLHQRRQRKIGPQHYPLADIGPEPRQRAFLLWGEHHSTIALDVVM